MAAATTHTRLRPRLAFSSLLVRTSVLFAFLSALVLWGQIRQFPVGQKQRLLAFVFHMPRVVFFAFFAATIVTVVADLIVRGIIRPLIEKWHAPVIDPDATHFHFDLREPVLEQTSARRKSGRLWRVGTLVRTERRIAFHPVSWDLEPLTLELRDVASVETVPPPRMFFGFIRGVPDRVRILTHDGTELLFAVPDPSAVQASFCPKVGGLVSWVS